MKIVANAVKKKNRITTVPVLVKQLQLVAEVVSVVYALPALKYL